MDKRIKQLKAQKSKLLNKKECKSVDEFEEIQNKLNLIEAELQSLNYKGV